MGSSAYTRDIIANGADGIHSSSPHWVLTFVRWNNRYLKDAQESSAGDREYFLSTRKPLVVENDCASVSVSYEKNNHTPSMSAMLYMADLNYITAIAPGDFVFVNMVETPEEGRRIGDLARDSKAINGVLDGFKGVFKVQSVRRILGIDPGSGTKRVMCQITGFAFTEFNNTMYFNPFLLSPNLKATETIFVSPISDAWQQLVAKKKSPKVQELLKIFINYTIGSGVPNINRPKDVNFVAVNPNTHFYIPTKVGELLGLPNAKAAKDIYNYLFGIQEYAAGKSGNIPLSVGMNPKLPRVEGRYYFTPVACQGDCYVKPEYWNQVTVWSILNQYTNAPINELFTTLRVSPEGSVMPTLVFRQMPFSSSAYKGPSTKFMNLPRWRISPDLLKDINIGRDEMARINFVQVFGTVRQASSEANQAYISQQIAGGNWAIDQLDVRRSGLKPYIITSNFDSISTEKKATLAPTWAKLIGDAVIGSHLKLNGSIQTYGIVEPIAVGDNLELDGVVYHIEGLEHSCSLSSDGKKSFSTNIKISHGLDVRSEKGGKVFAQMDNVDTQLEQKVDQEKNDGNLPGFTDEQYIVGRDSDPGRNTTENAAFPSNPGSAPAKKETQKVDSQTNRVKNRSKKK